MLTSASVSSPVSVHINGVSALSFSMVVSFAPKGIVPNLHAVRSGKAVPEKGPVMLLYELFNDIKFDCVQSEGGVQFSRFKMVATIKDLTFEGTGPSKRLAKTAAAKAALATLCNISYSPMQTKLTPACSLSNVLLNKDRPVITEYDMNMCNELPQTFADTIGK